MAKIPIILEPGRADGKLAESQAIYDSILEQFQSDINGEYKLTKKQVEVLTPIIERLNDVQDTLTSIDADKPLSAQQGKILKELLDAKVIEIGGIPMDSEPTEGNTEHVVTSDGINKALAKKVNNITFEERSKNQDEKLSELDSRTDGISKQIIETNEDSIVIEDNIGNKVGEINSNGADFKNLKSDGKNVITDISGKQDVIVDLDTIRSGAANGATAKADVETLQDKTSEVSKEIIEIDEDFIIIEDKNGNEVFHLDENGFDAKNVKSNGKDVLTEQNLETLATKEEVEKAKVKEISSEITNNEEECQSWNSDEYDGNGNGEQYAKITPNGVSAKGFFDMNGNPIENVDKAKLIKTAIGDYRAQNVIHVGHDKDFKTIQDAIWSITDATADNQYLILVHDDYYVTSVTELWTEWKYKIKNASELELSDYIAAYIWTKNYINIMGVGNRVISVRLSLDEITNDKRASVAHNIMQKGSCTLCNLTIISHNTRYCIHSEGGSGSETSHDFCAIKNYKNLTCIYEANGPGNPNNRYDCPYGIGLANGVTINVDNCKWIGKNGAYSGYSHTHPSYTYPATVYIKNSIFAEENREGALRISDIASGVNNQFVFENSVASVITVGYDPSLPFLKDSDFDIRHSLVNYHGGGNKCRMNYQNIPVLKITTNAVNHSIESVSGTAFNDLFIDVFSNLRGTPNKAGVWTGCRWTVYSDTAGMEGINYSSLGYLLGDCTTNNKTLDIVVNGVTNTIVFNKRYGGIEGGTPKAYYSNDAIISEINAQLTNCVISFRARISRLFFDDEVEFVYNNTNERLEIDTLVKRDGGTYPSTGVALADNAENVCGIIAEPINPHESGYMIKRGKQRIYNALTSIAGNYYGVNNGTIVDSTKDNAVFYASDDKTLEWL